LALGVKEKHAGNSGRLLFVAEVDATESTNSSFVTRLCGFRSVRSKEQHAVSSAGDFSTATWEVAVSSGGVSHRRKKRVEA
jgi:hypothetical protein